LWEREQRQLLLTIAFIEHRSIMVRSYLRHEPTQAFGLICSPSGHASLARDGKTATVAALEDILVWDVKTGEQVSMWHAVGHRSAVTALAKSPLTALSTDQLWAVGYADGSIRIWDPTTASVRLTLNGHKSAVTSLCFDADGLILASGGQDTNVTLWDIIAENGLFRLKGHRDAITDIKFMSLGAAAGRMEATTSANTAEQERSVLLTSSKDGLLKVWDLNLQHCMETVLPGKGELWSVEVLRAEEKENGDSSNQVILVGNSEGIVKLYTIDSHAAESSANDYPSSSRLLIESGEITIAGNRRVSQIDSYRAGNDCHFVACSSGDRSVELFRVRTEDDIRKKLARRRRRNKEKAEKKGMQVNGVDAANAIEAEPTWADKLEPYTVLRPGKGRVKCFSFAEESNMIQRGGSIAILLALGSNSLEVYHIPMPKKAKDEGVTKEATLSCALDLPGHRAEVRALSLSPDDSLLASADSAGLLKVWNVATTKMVRTLPCGYALSLAWLPDNQHILVGCKDGTLKTYDARAGLQLEDIAAHTGPLWSVIVHPDGRSCVSASGDKDVKFWDFEARKQTIRPDDEDGEHGKDEEEPAEPQSTINVLGLTHVRTLKMTDDVLCARFSPDGRLLALSLLDSTVKIFYADSLKFFLSLYGHKLPVLSLDISGDSKLCVTVSADKNAKIWGLDYGDCHRSMFAHEESILAVAFEKGEQGGGLMGGREGQSHRFWTCAKDGKVKYWDGDKFQCIQTLVGHHGDVTGLTVGSKGSLVVTAGLDRSLRVWEKTEEPLFVEEEREREIEEMYENGNQGQRERDDDARQYGSLAEGTENDRTAGDAADDQVEGVLRSTKETLMAGERLLEAIEIAKEDMIIQADYEKQKRTTRLDLAPPARNAVLSYAFGPDEEIDPHNYVLKVTSKILPAQLDDALLVLPFDAVIMLMGHLEYWASKEWNVTLVSRILFFLLRNYHGQIVSNRIMRSTLQRLRGHLRASLQRQKVGTWRRALLYLMLIFRFFR
jgi:U3 small nucleolar RNA-associated protein 12